MLKKKTYQEMIGQALSYLESHSSITMVAPGSVSRSLVEATLNEVITAYNIADTSMRMAFISSSSGYFLDMIGELVGISRRQQQAAYVRSSDRNIRFYVNSGTLGDYIPKPGDPTRCQIPNATTISTSDGSVTYVTDIVHEAPAQATEIWVTARAQTVGTSSNLGMGLLSTHSLSDSVLVENTTPVTTGSELESDEALRYRIRNAVIVAQGANEAAILDAAISTAGISDVIINEFSSGAGSFELLLLPDGNRVPLNALLQVRSNVQNATAFGINFEVREPRYVPIAMDIELVFAGAVDTQQPLLRDLVASRVSTYVGALRPSSTLRIGRVRADGMSVSRLITDMHIRSMRIGGRPQLISDYLLGRDEVFIPDPEETSPFQVK